MPTSLKQDRITGVIYKHPFVITALLVLVVLITTGMQLGSKPATCAIMVLGYVLITGYGFFIRNKKQLTHEALIVLIFALGFMLKLGYVLYSDILTRQNDVAVFEEGNYNFFHSGYILYVRDNFALPQSDVREMGQFYHPPFHYFVSAVFLKVYEIFLPKGTHNYEGLQALSLLWSQFAVVMIYKNLKLLGISKESCPTAAAVISAFPTFTILAGSVNNDILSILLFFTAFYFGLKWFKEGKWKNIIFSALATGLGMMTKLSVGLIAFPLGFLFIVKLIKDLKVRKEGGKTFLNLAVFGLISAPLGLWYQIRNYLMYKVPLSYVLRSDNYYQDISRFTPVQRLFGFYGFPIEDYYINLGSDGEQDYNIFITEVKTLLFGEDNYRDDFTMSMAGYALLITLLIMILIAAAGFVVTVIKAKKSEDIWGDISMILLAVTQVGSIITFSLKYPHICSMNFRYSTPLILCGILFYTKISDIKLKGANKDLVTKITRAVAVAFMVFAIVFYTILWTYVKGEVAVVDVTW